MVNRSTIGSNRNGNLDEARLRASLRDRGYQRGPTSFADVQEGV